VVVPTANILHQDTIRRLSGDGAFDRGRTYFQNGRVTDVQRKDGAVHAKVRGTEVYEVRIWTKDESLAYSCSCPMGQSQAFCKHAVAVALASVGVSAPDAIVAKPPLAHTSPAPQVAAPPAPKPAPISDSAPPKATRRGIVDALQALSREELLMVVLEAALEDDAFRDRLIEKLSKR
jgi:hypothetical protein